MPNTLFSFSTLGAAVFWMSLLLSTIAVLMGLLEKSKWLLVASALLALPFACMLFLSPTGRFFIVVPALYLLATPLLGSPSGWPRLLTLLAIFAILGECLARFLGVPLQ